MSRLRPSTWLALAATLVLACAAGARAAGVEFTASVDRTRTSLTQPIHLTLSISSSENLSHVPAPEISLGDFDVYGPQVGTRMEMVNGRTTFARELTYELFARKPGRYTIGPVRLKMGGEVYETRAIPVEVTRSAPRRQPGQGSASGPSQSLEDNLFLRATADRQRAYVGQQVIVGYDLCYRYQLRDVLFKEIPDFAGFWAKELYVAQRLEPQRETIDHAQFNVAPLRRMALFPTSAGTHRIEPMAITCSISQGRRRGSLFDAFSLFDDPLFDRGQSVLLRSPPVEVVVLPLPARGQPAGFGGAVGTYELAVTAEPRDVPVGDPVTLRVTVTGFGNLQGVSAPELSGGQGIEVYDPKVEERPAITNGRLGGTKVFEYILIPERGGRLQVPSVKLAYFDPEVEEYRVLESAPVSLVSRGEVEEADDNAYALTRQEIQALGRDIRHIKPDAAELAAGGGPYGSLLFWMVQGLMPLAFVGLVLYRRHQQRLQGDVAYARRRRAPGEARQRLRRARELAGGGGADLHAEVQRSVLGFVADCANVAAAGLTLPECDRLLGQVGVGQGLRRRVEALLQTCEQGRFAPGTADGGERARLIDEAEELLAELARAMR